MTERSATNSPPGYLSIRNLSHRYQDAESAALDDISLDIARGSTFGLLGPNGAGKSTLLSILTGVLAPQAGAVTIAGLSLADDADAIKARSALVPQEYAFYPNLSARENLQFFAGLYGLSAAQWRERLERCVQVCRLQEVLDRRAEQYSGGLKRRLNLAIGLMAAPALLYLDEPTVGIDAVSRGYILDAIAHLKGSGVTIVYTSHYMEEVESLCDEVAVIDRGHVIARGKVAELLSAQGSQHLHIVFAQPLTPTARQVLTSWQPVWSDDRRVMITAPQTALDGVLRELGGHGAQIEQLRYGVSRLHDVYLKLLEDRA